METIFTTTPYFTDPKKSKAYGLIASAKLRNKIKIGDCIVCGDNSKIHLHHEDYDKPLDVVCLCYRCHKVLHGKRGDSGNVSKRNFRVLLTIDMMKSMFIKGEL